MPTARVRVKLPPPNHVDWKWEWWFSGRNLGHYYEKSDGKTVKVPYDCLNTLWTKFKETSERINAHLGLVYHTQFHKAESSKCNWGRHCLILEQKEPPVAPNPCTTMIALATFVYIRPCPGAQFAGVICIQWTYPQEYNFLSQIA